MSVLLDHSEEGERTSESSEAKTDRYGFLLVNGGIINESSDDPCPELVRHREMKWITLINQWDQVLEKKHSKIKTQCQKGIPASVRSKCWPLLCGAKQRQENNKDLYKTLESSPGQQNWIDVIQRDTDRQFPFHEMFQTKDGHGQQGLLQVLKAYTQFRPDEGYCQAQGPVAAVLLMNMPMEEAFWCLVQISELYLPGYYSPLLEGVLFDAAVLFAVLKRTCPAAYKHMQRQGVEPLMFATDWLMCLYSRHLPFNTLLRVWDLFFCNGVRVLFQVAVVLVRRCLGEARQRKECEGQMETLERLRSVRGHVQHEQADTFIQEVCSVPLSLSDLQRHTEKQLEKWRKERPGSTFDPRDRCHGYHMIREKMKEREKENEKKHRQSWNLSASVMRSHSSLSPAILRKKWKKRGSKSETEEWQERRLSKQDSDEDEKRRASVCGVAGELWAKTDKNPQEFSTHLQKDHKTNTNPLCTSAPETQPSSDLSDHSDTVFEEDEKDTAITATPSHTETKPSVSQKEDDSQTGHNQQEIQNQHSTDKEKKVQSPRLSQDEDISTHQDQVEMETQQESQPSQLHDEENVRNKLEEETQENGNKLKEEIDIKTCKSEEEVQLLISIQEEEVNITQQEPEFEVNTDTQEHEIHACNFAQEQENGMNNEHEVEIQIDSKKQEIYLARVEDDTKHNNKEKKEIKTNSKKQEVEIQEEKEKKAIIRQQEVEIQEEKEINANSNDQEVEIQEEKGMKADSSDQEEEIQEEKEIKTNISQQEVEIQEEKEINANSSDQEEEIQEEKETKAKGSNQEVEIQEENEIKANNCEKEVEIQEVKEIKANSSDQEVEIQEENVIKANINEQEVEIQDEKLIMTNINEQEVEIQDTLANNDNEEKLKTCLIHQEDESKGDLRQQEDSKQINEVEQTLETEEEMQVNVLTLEVQDKTEKQTLSIQEEDHVEGDHCESGSNKDEERTQEEQEFEREHSEEREKVKLISDAPEEETEETTEVEEKRRSNNFTVGQEESETVASSQIVMEHSEESEPPQDSIQAKDEDMEVNKISIPEHGEPDRISASSDPEPSQADNKEKEVEIQTNITTVSNQIKPSPTGSTSHPQLRLRRSSSSQTSYPTILSEDTFRDPQQSVKQESCSQTTKAETSDVIHPPQAQSSKPKDQQKSQKLTLPAQSKSDKPKRRGLFHRLRSDAPSKCTIPKIVIQDFSEGEEKLSSKERRRRRRMQERKEKEEEKERKKLEKELEKEAGKVRKKPQTRGKSFHVLSRKYDDDDVFGGNSRSQTLGCKRNSYSESYF